MLGCGRIYEKSEIGYDQLSSLNIARGVLILTYEDNPFKDYPHMPGVLFIVYCRLEVRATGMIQYCLLYYFLFLFFCIRNFVDGAQRGEKSS